MEELIRNCIIYRRKSTDDGTHQAVSLQSQEDDLQERVVSKGQYKIIANLKESMSAKAPGRPVFAQMCDMLRNGKANTIICWHLNRLARNPIDGGAIIWLVQNHGIKIITPEKTYDINDLMFMYLEFGMSNQFITDLRRSTARGVESKHKLGYAPIFAPLGYKNDLTKRQGLRDILVDELRFPLIRKMWDLLLTGCYSPTHILQIATDKWGLRRSNGNPISKSQIYKMFNNVFYTGQYMYAGEVHQGSHVPMINQPEFDKAQRILGMKGRSRPKHHEFSYTGLIRCICGSAITAHERYRKTCPKCHWKYNAATLEACPKCNTPAPEKTWYHCLYHCSKKHGTCTQPSIHIDDLEKQFNEVLANIRLPDSVIRWTLRKFQDKLKREGIKSEQTLQDIHSELATLTKRETVLSTRFFSPENEHNALLSESEYISMKENIRMQRKTIEQQLHTSGKNFESSLDQLEEDFTFTKNAQDLLMHGTLEQKRFIITHIGLNLTLDNRIVRIELKKTFNLFYTGKKLLENILENIEPTKQLEASMEDESFYDQSPVMGA